MDPHLERTVHAPVPQLAPDVRNDPAPLWALGEHRMSTAAHFRREHFPVPAVDPAGWRLRIGGSVATPAIVTLADLGRMPRRSLVVVLECAGHRRAELRPATPGLQWQEGAVSEARWTGTPLAGLLRAAGIDRGAAEVVLTGFASGTPTVERASVETVMTTCWPAAIWTPPISMSSRAVRPSICTGES